jgi:hypothetical protein
MNENTNTPTIPLSGIKDSELEARWLRLAIIDDALLSQEARAWTRNLLNQIRAELDARRTV